MSERKVVYLDDAIEAVRRLPNAGIHWYVSAEAVFDALLKLPSAEEDSAKEDEELGEWIHESRERLVDETDDGFVYATEEWWKCSKCGFDMGFTGHKPDERYCPICGDRKR